MEISQLVDQQTNGRRQRVLELIEAHAATLAHQGTVVASFRYRGGRAVGPYHRLAWRQGQVQQSVYLGTDADLVAEVHVLLQELQQLHRERRALRRQKNVVRKVLAECRAELRRELGRRGLRLQGYEVRGWHTPGPRAAGIAGRCGRKK